MGWITILLAVLQAIPAIIKIIQELRDIMKDRSPEEKRLVGGKLREVLRQWRADHDSKSAADKIVAIIHGVQ